MPGTRLEPATVTRMNAAPRDVPSSTLAWFGIVAAVFGISVAAPIGAATAAPALAVAFWRTAGGALATLPLAGARHGGELARLPRRAWIGATAAGVALAVHFALWIPSLRLTSVTASTALVATTPLWTVVLVWWRGGPPPSRVLLAGVALALAGVLAVTGVDARLGLRALLGDGLALGGGIAGAAYVLAGERVRQRTSTAVYTVLAYGVAAVLLLLGCLLSGEAIAGFSARTWIELAVLMVAAQLFGHSLFNAALPVVGATPASLSILLEVPGAALVAWAWLGSAPPWTVLPGTVLVLAGLVLVIRGGRRTGEADTRRMTEASLASVAQVTSPPPDAGRGAG